MSRDQQTSDNPEHVAAIGAFATAVLRAGELGVASPHETAASLPAEVIAAGGDALDEALKAKKQEAASRRPPTFDEQIRRASGRR